MKVSILYFITAVTILCGFFLISSYVLPEPKDKETQHKIQELRLPRLPVKMDFAGEAVPLQDAETLERIDREIISICFGHATVIQNLRFSVRYFSYMEEIFKKYGIPDDFKYLAVTESNLRNVTSSAGAKGVWQFMQGTAKDFNLIVNQEVDERLNFFKSTEAACQYLKKLKDKFGSWTLAAAAYNCGEGRISERMKSQEMENYYDLYLPEETMRYVPRILAFKEILKKPESYGFHLQNDDFLPAFPTYKKVIVDSMITQWSAFAKNQGLSLKKLIYHNPWILSNSLINKEKNSFEILLPVE